MIRSDQKGISQIAVMVIMLVLAVALPITTKLVQQRQENRSMAACDGGSRVYFDGSSCRWGTTANCTGCNGSGGANNCYSDMSGCTAAHPSGGGGGQTYSCPASCSANYGCRRVSAFQSSTSSCSSPIGSVSYSTDCSCPKRYGAGGGNDDTCNSCGGGSQTYNCPASCSANYGCRRVSAFQSRTADCSSPVGSVSYNTDCSCPKRYGAGGGNDDTCNSCGGGGQTYNCPASCSANYGCRKVAAFQSSTSDCGSPIGNVSYSTDCSCPKRNGAGGGNDDTCNSCGGSGGGVPAFTPTVTTTSNSLTISIRDGANIHHIAVVDSAGKWLGNMIGASSMWGYTVSGLSAGTYTYSVNACSVDSSSTGDICPSNSLTIKSVTGTVGGGVTPTNATTPTPTKTPTPTPTKTPTPTPTKTPTPTPTRAPTPTNTPTPTPTRALTSTPTPTVVAGSTRITIKLAFAGVKKDNGQCATNWLTALAMKNSAGSNVLSVTNLKVVPSQSNETNGKGEIIYSFNATITNIANGQAINGLSFFLTGPKHVSLKFGKNNQTSWYSDLAGALSVTGGQSNEYDFSDFSLLAGDVTGDTAGVPDGKIDGRDFSYIKEKVNASTLISGSAGSNVDGDLDGNCQVNAGDVALIKSSLKEVNGQTY